MGVLWPQTSISPAWEAEKQRLIQSGFDFKIAIPDRHYNNPNNPVQYGFRKIDAYTLSLHLDGNTYLDMENFRVVWRNKNSERIEKATVGAQKDPLIVNVGLYGLIFDKRQFSMDRQKNRQLIWVDAPKYQPQKCLVHILRELLNRGVILDEKDNTAATNVDLMIIKILPTEHNGLRSYFEDQGNTIYSRLFFILWNRNIKGELPDIVTQHREFYTTVSLTATAPNAQPVVFYDITRGSLDQDRVYHWVKQLEKEQKPPFLYISNGVSHAYTRQRTELPEVLEDIYEYPALTPQFIQELESFYEAYQASEARSAGQVVFYFLISSATVANLQHNPGILQARLQELKINPQDALFYVSNHLADDVIDGFKRQGLQFKRFSEEYP